ncbi:hypothetical protein J2W51_003874 [Tardiphaga robiniae]|uniref:hypothetical protein n=1 Tax=Tardiphaga robiniae TaxID=943830 RepID=UPI0028582B7D|nr:hypothetical protein [Tardiphaga robiniae]MDR6661288.1 hypothetical protein [Tardiphaga robiniae]
MTRGDEMIVAAATSLETLRKLAFGPYARHEISAVIDPLGSRLETFLRTVVLPTSRRKDRLVDMIADLAAHGLDQPTRDGLDGLRELYNDSKHKPQIPLLLARATSVTEGVLSAIADICTSGIGVTGAPLGRELNYSLWVGFWDYYTGGMTEAAVMLPGDHWTHVSTVDTIQMRISDWDTLKPALQTHPRFRLGEPHFEPKVWKSMRDEGDFLNAGVWDGEYAELLRLLAPFHNADVENSVIPGTRRRDSVFSVSTAVIMAAVDVARAAGHLPTENQLQEEITRRAADEYAMTSDSPYVARCAAQLATCLLGVPYEHWSLIAGPVIVKRGAAIGTSVEGTLPLALDGHAIVLQAF